ncbi:DUF1800 family protein [Phycisphaerales bacterium AB-hyl4]|uniref:DUF1800 family protein n=1 Tax=Natronomicrosphaera hydrolytica TaxID=3242702 RepID=A0ABV4U9U8_9BACT
MAVNTSFSRLADDDFGPAQARHLLRRAAFGPEPGQSAKLVEIGLDAAVDQLVDYQTINWRLPNAQVDPDLMRPYTPEEQRRRQQARRAGDQDTLDRLIEERLRRLGQDRAMFHELQQWWLDVMLRTPRPLEENLTLLWHDHFATRHRNVRSTFQMYQQNMLFRQHANRSFADLAFGIVRDPAMLRFLDNNLNRRSNPNENLARELMELFTLGEGNYTEQDIKEAARALTGYHVDHNDFHFNQRAHDGGQKTILGRRTSFDGDTLVRHLLQQNASALFVAYKLYRHFVADVIPDRATPTQVAAIRRLATLVRRNEYRLAPVLKTLFKSQHFYDAAIVGKKIKSPTQLAAGSVRMMNTPHRDAGALRATMEQLGQAYFDPPSVAGWDVGRAWVNTSTLFTRQNLCLYLLTGHPAVPRASRNSRPYDPMPLIAHLPEADRTPEKVINDLVDQLVGDHIPADRRTSLVRDLERRAGATVRADALVPALVLITTMPEYQLC